LWWSSDYFLSRSHFRRNYLYT